MSLCLCRSVVMFWLCKVQTSVNNLRHTCSNKTKDQSERVKNYRTWSPSSTIFNMAASGEDVVGGEVEVHEDIGELLSETVRKYSVLYDKTSLSSSSSAVRRSHCRHHY